MKKATVGIIIAGIIAAIAAFALSPYFTESTINEELPDNIIMMPMEPDDTESDTMESDTMESDTMESEMQDTTESTAYTPAKETIAITYEGQFIGVGDGIHDAQGIAKVLPLDDGSQILRLEDFASTNGPDLYVYLSTDKHASDFISLGNLKANQGNQNYQVPDGIDLEKYDQVLIWCKPFSVLFGNAELNPR